MIQFEVPGVPAPQGSHRAFMRKGARFPIVTDDNPRTKPWRALVAMAAMPHRPREPWQGAIEVQVAFYLPRPKSLPKRVLLHTKKPDLDKLVRGIFDALKGVIWVDDSQVVKVTATKHYGPPGASILMREVKP